MCVCVSVCVLFPPSFCLSLCFVVVSNGYEDASAAAFISLASRSLPWCCARCEGLMIKVLGPAAVPPSHSQAVGGDDSDPKGTGEAYALSTYQPSKRCENWLKVCQCLCVCVCVCECARVSCVCVCVLPPRVSCSFLSFCLVLSFCPHTHAHACAHTHAHKLPLFVCCISTGCSHLHDFV